MPAITLRDVPAELHAWIEAQARLHGRAIGTEAVELLDRQRRVVHGARRRITAQQMLAIGERVARAPALDERSPDEILGYDENGLPH
jgi:antitoxin VapB